MVFFRPCAILLLSLLVPLAVQMNSPIHASHLASRFSCVLSVVLLFRRPKELFRAPSVSLFLELSSSFLFFARCGPVFFPRTRFQSCWVPLFSPAVPLPLVNVRLQPGPVRALIDSVFRRDRGDSPSRSFTLSRRMLWYSSSRFLEVSFFLLPRSPRQAIPPDRFFVHEMLCPPASGAW